MLKAKTPEKAARELVKYLIDNYSLLVGSHPTIRDNSVYWEEGPYDWTCITMGTDLLAPEFGRYSDPSEKYPNGLTNDYVYAEAINSYSLTFYKH